MAGATADGFFRPIYEGCISGFDNCIERRPYHRNCGCALHSKSRNKLLSGANNKSPIRPNSVKYPMRRAWSEGNLVLAAASSSHHSSPSSSPSHSGLRNQRCFVDREDEEEEEHHNNKTSA